MFTTDIVLLLTKVVITRPEGQKSYPVLGALKVTVKAQGVGAKLQLCLSFTINYLGVAPQVTKIMKE